MTYKFKAMIPTQVASVEADTEEEARDIFERWVDCNFNYEDVREILNWRGAIAIEPTQDRGDCRVWIEEGMVCCC